MKIEVTAENNNGLESVVAQHFGHAPYFIKEQNADVILSGGMEGAFPPMPRSIFAISGTSTRRVMSLPGA
jgi:hypothetical protein